ncbi:MAG: hypothetical protein DRG37_04335 [Deltaproteobacteria bacterium]|nr:MAG: hypothetical protein DRG37_04335 [Deltaproteobacteria bacterium]
MNVILSVNPGLITIPAIRGYVHCEVSTPDCIIEDSFNILARSTTIGISTTHKIMKLNIPNQFMQKTNNIPETCPISKSKPLD